MSHWRATPASSTTTNAADESKPAALISTSHPLTYADRLRIR